MILSPDIITLKSSLDGCITSAKEHIPNTHAAIKIQSLLDLTVYIIATRFLEASVKHVVYNCAKMRGDTSTQLDALSIRLKSFNNPEFTNIKELILNELNYDIIQDKGSYYQERDVSFLNEICRNRHRNVHANEDPRNWHNTNTKNIANFEIEYAGILNTVEYLSHLVYDTTCSTIKYR